MTGFVLLPDSWTAPAGISFTPGWMADGTHFPDDVNNTYDSWEWKKMEEAGAVFIPAGGYVYERGYDVDYYCSQKYGGRYWVASDTVVSINGDSFTPNYTAPNGNYPITYASIRLVVDSNQSRRFTNVKRASAAILFGWPPIFFLGARLVCGVNS